MAAKPGVRQSSRAGFPVAVFAEDRGRREEICAILVAGTHTVSARESNVERLVSACDGEAPACVVLAALRPDQQATNLARELRSKLDDPHLVIVSERVSSGEIRRALEIGVHGIVLSDNLGAALAPVVSSVCAGQVSVPSGQSDQLRAPVLTTREKQILGLVVMGLSNGEIARKLYLAESTVKSHLSSAFSKLGVSSRNEAVGIILDPDRGKALGILTIPAETVPSGAGASKP